METQQTQKIKGTVIWKSEKTEQTSKAGNSYLRIEFLVEYQEGAYKYTAGFQAYNKTAQVVDRLLIGDVVTVKFRAESTSNNNRIFTSLVAWGITPHWNEIQTPVPPQIPPQE